MLGYRNYRYTDNRGKWGVHLLPGPPEELERSLARQQVGHLHPLAQVDDLGPSKLLQKVSDNACKAATKIEIMDLVGEFTFGAFRLPSNFLHPFSHSKRLLTSDRRLSRKNEPIPSATFSAMSL